MNLKDLHELLRGVNVLEFKVERTVKVGKITIDSREVKTGDLFVAINGTRQNGHDFIPSALLNGAAVIVCTDFPREMPEEVCFVKVDDTSDALGIMASNYYGNPSGKLKLIGVTGTNGKTTIATLLYQLIGQLGFKAGLLSTIENKLGSKTIVATHTTPDLLKINQFMAEMVENGCDYAVMEVSSHAIHQRRIAGLDFDGGIFTNLTAEHLDYHNSLKEYLYAKKKFFDLLKPEAFALTNADDKNGMVMLQNSKAIPKTYALKRMADYKGLVLRNSLQGLQMKVNQKEVYFKLIGLFNAYNLLAVFGAAHMLGFGEDEILIAMSTLGPARGRFEIIFNPAINVTAIIDYAHTADALENVLKTVHEVKGEGVAIITVAGAGGDRDRTKRPQMGRVCANYSDTVILTTDNPRSEEPGFIAEEMLSGIEEKDRSNILTVLDRAEAIRVALKIASEGDIVLIAGKGHETYQEIKGIRYPFDDKEIVKNIWF